MDYLIVEILMQREREREKIERAWTFNITKCIFIQKFKLQRNNVVSK